MFFFSVKQYYLDPFTMNEDFNFLWEPFSFYGCVTTPVQASIKHVNSLCLS